MSAEVKIADDVLAFWFDGDIDDNYKHKWFPAGDKTGAIQRKIDDDIARTFGATVAAAESGALSRWRDDSPRAACALALLLDQFTRHVHRNAPDRDARVAAADAIAVDVAERCVERGWDAALTTPEQVFLLMPFRHGKSRTIPRLRVALARLDARIATHAQHASLLAKFRKTTLRCLQDMEGKQHADGDEILERSEFTPDAATDATMASHALYATVDAFVRERAGLPRGDDRSRNPRWRRPPPKRPEGEEEEEDASSNASAEDEPSTSTRRRQSPAWPAVGISLSGGVDSMALAVILKRLSRDASYGGFDVVAMHIDYDNRPESGVEADFVRGWCDRMGIECVVRKIAEVTRGVTPREQYEAESRAIRYGFYKDVAKTHAFPAVFVGHHEGDVQENIIANLMRGANLLAVNGMEETGVVEGVAIWRPMLPHSKAVVLDFAHKYGVPYFLDSTPTWSTRGKLRNQLVPLLADMFGEGFSRNLSLLGEDSAQLGAMVESACLKPFLDGMTLSDAGAYAECKTYVDQPLFFWKEAMKRMCHGLGSGMMKEKSVRELLDRFALKKRRRPRDGWITLKKTNKSFVDGDVFAMFSEQFFPPHDSIAVGAKVALDAATPLTFGPWTVTARLVSNVREEGEGGERVFVLATEPPLDVYAVLRNDATYHLPFTGGDGGLYLDPRARIPAFKGVDAAVVKAMPVVVPAGLGDDDDDDGGGGGGGGGGGIVAEYKAKTWPTSLSRAETCVEVRLTFTRTRSHADHLATEE